MFSEIVDLLKSAPRLEKISVGHDISASSDRYDWEECGLGNLYSKLYVDMDTDDFCNLIV
jgi:hypothetical protein